MKKTAFLLDTICPACKSTKNLCLAKYAQGSYHLCTVCGLEYVWPQPAPNNLETSYQDYYAGQRVEQSFDAVTALTLPVLTMNIETAFGKGNYIGFRFLDVGCGGGHFVRAAEMLGLEAVGIDIDNQTIDNAKKRGLNVISGVLPHPSLAAASFDLIKLMHVVEHVPDPNALFVEVAKLLSPGGVIWVDVPNQASFMARMKKILHFLGRDDYGYLQPPFHLTAFNKKSMQALLARTGFSACKVVRSSPVDSNTYPRLANMYAGSLKYRLFEFLYRVSWRLGDSPYISIMASLNAQS
jgi:SAM-dependent methyltransferase